VATSGRASPSPTVEGQSSNVSLCCIYDQQYNSLAVARYGARVYWNVEGSGNYADGQWVVRAP